MNDGEPGLCDSGVKFTKSVVELIVKLAQHDPPAPSDPALCLPTLSEARWVHLELAVCGIVNAFESLKMEPAETATTGKFLCQPV